MSKKHKKAGQALAVSSSRVTHTAEYRIIKHDLAKVAILNAIYLAAVLALYYSNAKTGYLEQWFGRILHF